MQIRIGLSVTLLALVFNCWSLTAYAQSDNYKVQVTPYGFLTGVNGTIGEAGRTANVDASFGDVLDHLNMVAMVYADARFGRWRATLDNLYTDVSAARATPGPLFSSVRVATRLWIADPEGGYAVFQREGKEVDVVAGVRVWSLKNNLTFFRDGLQADFSRGTRSVVDPIVGMHFSSNLPHNMFVFAKGDVGGFNAGAALDWQAFGGAGYKFNEHVVASLGYRYLSIQNEPGNSIYDVHLNGAILGLGFRF
jgi:opacity protein-like surface antigen